MKIIIDIPKVMYEAAKQNYWCGSPTMGYALKYGVPLPKGHGRLIDVDTIKPIKAPIAPLKLSDSVHYEWVYMRDWIDNAPTIIEADVEEI